MLLMSISRMTLRYRHRSKFVHAKSGHDSHVVQEIAYGYMQHRYCGVQHVSMVAVYEMLSTLELYHTNQQARVNLLCYT